MFILTLMCVGEVTLTQVHITEESCERFLIAKVLSI